MRGSNVLRAGAAAVAVLVLLGIVALAARGSHPTGHGRIAARQVPASVSDDLLTILVVLFCVGVLVMVVVFLRVRNKWHPVKSNWLGQYVFLVLFFTLFALVGQHLIASRIHHRQTTPPDQVARGGVKPLTHFKNVSSGGAHFNRTLAIGLLGLIMVAGTIFYVRYRTDRPAPRRLSDADVKEDLASAVSEAIDDLEREPDARRAVIGAYARMERALARHNHGRRPAEAPFEYLSRILLTLSVRQAAVEELTDLFEHAKFSAHDVGLDMKRRAIAALTAIRDDLDERAVAA